MSSTSASVTKLITSATSLTLDTPAETTPNTGITVTGTYKGTPQALDYNFGAGWVEASSVNFSAGVFSFKIPAGVAAGSYVPEIRDHTATTVTDSAGNFVVSAWTPENLTSSPGAKVVFSFDANDPASTVLTSSSAVSNVVNAANTSQSLGAKSGSTGNPVLVADGSGADGARRLLQFHATTVNPNNADPAANWLSAGGVNGSGGSALVDLVNSSNLSKSGSFTTTVSLDINKSFSYEAGPIWGSLASPGPLQYSQLRYNQGSGQAGAQLVDSSNNGTAAQSTIAAGWHVLTMIKDNGTLIYRLDGKQISSQTVTSNLSFTAQDFMLGGGFPPATSASKGAENGVPAPYVGDFQAYSGVLQGGDLANAEKLAGNAVGVSLTPTVTTTIALSALGTVQEVAPGAGASVSETVSAYGLSSVYEAVFTAAGVAETGYTQVGLDSSGAGSFVVHLAKTGDYVKAENSLTNPTITGTSSPVTLTEPPVAPVFISGPGVTATLTTGETLYDTGSGNTLVLPASGPVIVSGNTANNGDMFDLRAAMATTSWDGIPADLGKYLTSATSNGGKDLQVLLHAQGGTASTVLATLTAVGGDAGAFGRFEQHAILTVSAAQAGGLPSAPLFISGPGARITLTNGELLYDTGSANKLTLPGSGSVTISGNTVNNSDTFDIHAALAGTTWDGKSSDLGNYLTQGTTNGGKDLQVLLHPTGGSASSVLATFTAVGGDPGAFGRFEQHAILTGPSV